MTTNNAVNQPSLTADGQLMIGSSAGGPLAGTITAGTNITVTNANNSITIASTGGGGGSMTLLASQTAANSATLDFANFFSSSYDQYYFEFINVLPATNSTTMQVLLGTGGGPTYVTANYFHNEFCGVGADGSYNNFGSNSDSAAYVTPHATYVISNSATYAGVSGSMWLSGTNGSSAVAKGNGNCSFISTQATNIITTMFGFSQPAATFTAIRFQMASGNITSGTIRMYGISNSAGGGGGGSGALVFLSSSVASSSASLAFVNQFSSSYNQYLFTFNKVLPATDNAILYCQLGTGAGPTYATTGYQWINPANTISLSKALAGNNSDAQAQVGLGDGFGVSFTAGNGGVSGQLILNGTNASAGIVTGMGNLMVPASNAGVGLMQVNPAFFLGSATYTAIKFYYSSGNIASGTISMFGIANS